MFVDFDRVFHPTEEQKRQDIEQINHLIRKNIENYGECCVNCKYLKGINVGHGWMDYRCEKTRKWPEEYIKCEHYEFCGFLTEDIL